MTEIHTTTGHLDPGQLGEAWALIVGGVTRAGNRRARRAVTQALHQGLDVVWLDGYEESYDGSGGRVPLEGSVEGANVVVVGYQAAEAASLAGRLHTAERWQSNPLARNVWRLILRRVGGVLRPRAGWKAVRRDLALLSGLPAPVAIVYADDYAITIAWQAGRIWESVPIVSSFPETA